MKVVILDGFRSVDECRDKVPALIIEQLSSNGVSHDITHFIFRDMKIGPCSGCFECWVKTPGSCRQKDDGGKICESVVNSDIVILLSPVVYGGYSSEMKKGIERNLPILSPFFMLVDGEVHHQKRYPKYPRYAMIGVQTVPDKDTADIFLKLVQRNAINLYESNPGTGIICLTDGPDKQVADVRAILKTAGGLS